MRCNCQMSFSISFDRPMFKLRSHRKRMDNTTRIGRPMASVARTMLKNSESRVVRDWVIGSLQIKASGGRIQQRGDDDKRIDLRVSGETSVVQEVHFDAFKQRALEASFRPAFMPPCFLDTRPARKRESGSGLPDPVYIEKSAKVCEKQRTISVPLPRNQNR